HVDPVAVAEHQPDLDVVQPRRPPEVVQHVVAHHTLQLPALLRLLLGLPQLFLPGGHHVSSRRVGGEGRLAALYAAAGPAHTPIPPRPRPRRRTSGPGQSRGGAGRVTPAPPKSVPRDLATLRGRG